MQERHGLSTGAGIAIAFIWLACLGLAAFIVWIVYVHGKGDDGTAGAAAVIGAFVAALLGTAAIAEA